MSQHNQMFVGGVPSYYLSFQMPQQFQSQHEDQHPQPKHKLNSNSIPNHLSHPHRKMFTILNPNKKFNQKKGKVDPRRWSQKEETELAKALVNISEDNATGKNQMRSILVVCYGVIL
ncbi:unnamed protein product [Lactuca virosa]|uniref:Myb-like domain-containing protein n=1 Tax=Lactuca virosa TaxID=75947 RepID=A0AAU9PKJ0_9ASTR|nr:unnamed protein product [Lactuca virosa]